MPAAEPKGEELSVDNEVQLARMEDIEIVRLRFAEASMTFYCPDGQVILCARQGGMAGDGLLWQFS